MNYFAHACGFLDRPVEPAFLAGLAVPDWLNVVNRRIKTKSRAAERFLQSDHVSPSDRDLARGIIQHHADDRWFHQTPAFNQLSLEFAVELRELLAPDPGFRPSFLGHILIELLLDDFLIGEYPERLDRYYSLLADLDHRQIESSVGQIAKSPVYRLAWFIDRFLAVRFLCDYASDEKLLMRLNQVMQRVKLPPLPTSLEKYFGSARDRVASQVDQLYYAPLSQASNA